MLSAECEVSPFTSTVMKPNLRLRCLKTPMNWMFESTRSGWVRIERWMKGWRMIDGLIVRCNCCGVMGDVWSLNSIIGTSTICIAIWNIYIWFIIIWNFYFLEIHISIYDSYLWLLFVVYIDVLPILHPETFFRKLSFFCRWIASFCASTSLWRIKWLASLLM